VTLLAISVGGWQRSATKPEEQEMRAYRFIVPAVLFAIVLFLAGCDFAAGPEGPEVPATAQTTAEPTVTPVDGATDAEELPNTRLAVTVQEEPFTLSDLAALPRAQVSAAGQTYEGVAILDLLAAAQVTDVLSITLVARDAVSTELGVLSLTPQSILAFTPENLLDAILPENDPEDWLHDVVVIVSDPESRIELWVGETPITQGDLQAIESVEVQAGGATYEGVPILDLLSAAGVEDAVTVIFENRAGESVEIPVTELTRESILAFGQDGTLQAILPGLVERTWLAGITAIRTTP
jgi:hypothetical protein